MSHPFELFDQVRIINLADRTDRRREMIAQLERLGGVPACCTFFEAQRPVSPGQFPSLGARGCFESQLEVLRGARDAGAETLLLLEDDVDFTRSGVLRLDSTLDELWRTDWSFFYGAHVMSASGRNGLVELRPEEPVLTASFVGFRGAVISELVKFLEAMQLRPAGSQDHGPMHVDGAYTVFRELQPNYKSFAAFPTLGHQRSSPSDITPSGRLLDRRPSTRKVANVLRRANNWLRRQ